MDAQVTFLNYYHGRHAMWFKKVAVRAEDGRPRRQRSLIHCCFKLFGIVQCIEIALEELSDDVSAKVLLVWSKPTWIEINSLINLFLLLHSRDFYLLLN